MAQTLSGYDLSPKTTNSVPLWQDLWNMLALKDSLNAENTTVVACSF